MLINQHRVTVGVQQGDMGRAGGGFIGFGDEGNARSRLDVEEQPVTPPLRLA